MISSTSLDAYRSHDLGIQIRTSSGDEVNLNFSNKQSLSYNTTKDTNSSSTSLSFSSEQSYQFEVKGNGIDAQDAKEIKEYLKIAQPFIDDFMAELEGDAQNTPLNKMAEDLNSIFAPLKEKPQEVQNSAKNSIVSLFDNALNQTKEINKVFNEAQKLLDKVLEGFDTSFEKFLYA